MAVAPVEAHYSREMVSCSQKCWQEQKLHSRLSWTGPSNFQYQKEKQLAVNQKLSWWEHKFPGLPTLDGCKPCSNSVLNGECFLKPPHNCNIFPQKESLPYFGFPGLGLNAGVALLNLTRFFFFPTSLLQGLKIIYLYLSFFRLRDLPGGGFTEISRFIWQKHRLAMYSGYILIWSSHWIISMTKLTESWLGDFEVILSDISEKFSANLLLSLRELCHRLKLTLADQDVLNLVGGSQKSF